MGAPSLPPSWQLYLMDHRISTFKNWPFLEGCACTPERVSPTPSSLGPAVFSGLGPGPEAPPPLCSVPSTRPPTPLLLDPVRRGPVPLSPVGSAHELRCCRFQMAEAGFVHCPTENEPDLAQCFFCFKELEGWEPDDNPM